MGLFFLMNNVALALRGPLLVLLTSGLGIHYLVSNVLSLVGLTLVRFALADTWIWAKAPPSEVEPRAFSYDIHGIVTVKSDARLPELERFRIGELIGEADIRVRVGKVAPNGHSRRPLPRGSRSPGVRCRDRSRRSHRGDRIAAAPAVPARALHQRRRADPSLDVRRARLRARARGVPGERRGRLPGHRQDRYREDDHEPAHARRHPYSFLSDDLTLVSPDGRVLTYPKPLTISRHTLKAVKTPLLSRRERIGLVVQSRLHSRSGRRFALILARTHLPAATINAVVQMIVPPPKYHVERLVPGVAVAPEARLTGMVVIQRGGEGAVSLDESEALETLMRNCEDAYGFPPYSEIEGSLRRRNGSDLKDVERGIVASALSGLPAAVMRSETMDWWRRLPGVVSRWTPSAPPPSSARPCRTQRQSARMGRVQALSRGASTAEPRAERLAPATRLARPPTGAYLALILGDGRRAEGVAAQQHGVQQRRSGLCRPGGGDRRPPGARRALPRSSGPIPCWSRRCCRSGSSCTWPRASSGSRSPPWAWRRSTWSTSSGGSSTAARPG